VTPSTTPDPDDGEDEDDFIVVPTDPAEDIELDPKDDQQIHPIDDPIPVVTPSPVPMPVPTYAPEDPSPADEEEEIDDLNIPQANPEEPGTVPPVEKLPGTGDTTAVIFALLGAALSAVLWSYLKRKH